MDNKGIKRFAAGAIERGFRLMGDWDRSGCILCDSGGMRSKSLDLYGNISQGSTRRYRNIYHQREAQHGDRIGINDRRLVEPDHELCGPRFRAFVHLTSMHRMDTTVILYDIYDTISTIIYTTSA
jgi:hypothetical protein